MALHHTLKQRNFSAPPNLAPELLNSFLISVRNHDVVMGTAGRYLYKLIMIDDEIIVKLLLAMSSKPVLGALLMDSKLNWTHYNNLVM